MQCCEAKPIENCFDPISFECVDFQKLNQIIANLSRENLAEREAERTNLPWTQREKDNELARCRFDNVLDVPQNPCSVSMLSLMKTVFPWKIQI